MKSYLLWRDGIFCSFSDVLLAEVFSHVSRDLCNKASAIDPYALRIIVVNTLKFFPSLFRAFRMKIPDKYDLNWDFS